MKRTTSRVQLYNIPVMRVILEKMTEPLQAIEIVHGLPCSPSTAYDAMHILTKTRNLATSVGENIHGRATVVYSLSEQGRQLLEALSTAESLLK